MRQVSPKNSTVWRAMTLLFMAAFGLSGCYVENKDGSQSPKTSGFIHWEAGVKNGWVVEYTSFPERTVSNTQLWYFWFALPRTASSSVSHKLGLNGDHFPSAAFCTCGIPSYLVLTPVGAILDVVLCPLKMLYGGVTRPFSKEPESFVPPED